MIAALAYALTWYNGDVAEWMRIIQVLVLCAVGALAYALGLFASGVRPRHLRP
jgi:putative peptidoglycan lipid II flippase